MIFFNVLNVDVSWYLDKKKHVKEAVALALL